MILCQRDPFGFEQVIYHPASASHAASLRDLLQQASVVANEIDTLAVAGHLDGKRRPDRTILQGFLAVPPGHDLSLSPHGLATTTRPAQAAPGNLEVLLLASLDRVLQSGRRTAIALSGGLDSALLLALLGAVGGRNVPAYVLATDMPHYDERDAAVATARRHGAEVILVEACEGDFVGALPLAMHHLEEPLYNLHPIAKLLLAKAMRRDGIEVAISGDGADQVLRRDTSADYLPLCRTLFQAAGVELVPPFVDGDVVAHLLSLPPDSDKRCLRALARNHGVARDLTDGPKRSRLAPAMDLAHLLPPSRIDALATRLGIAAPPMLDTDAQRVRWATLLVLLADLGVSD